MMDLTVSDHNLQEQKFCDIVGTGMALHIQSSEPPHEHMLFAELEELRKRYSGKIIISSSFSNQLIHPYVRTYFPNLHTVADVDQNLLRYLANKWKLDKTITQLRRQLKYQVLYQDGNMIGSWLQPLQDQWRQFLDNKEAVKIFFKKFGSYGIKWLNKQDKSNHVLWEDTTGRDAHSGSIYNTRSNPTMPEMETYLKNYLVFSNKELITKLESI